MIRILFFLLFSLSNLYSQTTKIILVDYLNKSPIANAIVLEPNGQFITKSENDGSFVVNNTINEINISANGYNPITVNPQNLATISLEKTTINLEEVVLRNANPIKIGSCLDKRVSSDAQCNGIQNEYVICATRINLNHNSSIENYNFCINVRDSKEHNSPFNFQIYSEKEGFPDKIIYNQYMSNYKQGWNKVDLERVLNLEKGTYFIAMQWIPLPDKSDVWVLGERSDGSKVFVSGQALSFYKAENKTNSDFICSKTKKWTSTQQTGQIEHRAKRNMFAQYIEIYEN